MQHVSALPSWPRLKAVHRQSHGAAAPVLFIHPLMDVSACGCCEQCRYENSCTSLHLNTCFQFCWVYARSRISRSHASSVQLFQEPPNCFPQRRWHFTFPPDCLISNPALALTSRTTFNRLLLPSVPQLPHLFNRDHKASTQ